MSNQVDLSKFGKALSKGAANANKPIGADIPDGKHKGQIKSADISLTKDGNPRVMFRVATLGYKSPLFQRNDLKTDEDAERLGKSLGVLGIQWDTENPNELHQKKNEAVGKWIAFEKKTKPDGKGGYFINLYFNMLIEAPDNADIEAANASASEPTDDEDIPF